MKAYRLFNRGAKQVCLVTTIFLSAIVSVVGAQDFSERIVKQLSFEKISEHNAVMVANINGSISVNAYDGDKILIELTKIIRGKTSDRIESGKAEVQLNIIDLADTIIIYASTPCHRFERSHYSSAKVPGGQRWGYTSSCGSEGACHEKYEYQMDFNIKVPAQANVIVSTMNNGNVIVKDVAGVVTANNINGDIQLDNLSREAGAHTVNGDVSISYSRHPARSCRFYSLNGDVNAVFPKGLSANVSFQSFNGAFYTNIECVEKLPAHLLSNKKGSGVRYKVSNNGYRIGAGGPVLDFETFNGNVYLKERNN